MLYYFTNVENQEKFAMFCRTIFVVFTIEVLILFSIVGHLCKYVNVVFFSSIFVVVVLDLVCLIAQSMLLIITEQS